MLGGQGSSSISEHFWREKMNKGEAAYDCNGYTAYIHTYTIGAIVLILIWQLVTNTRFLRFAFRSQASSPFKESNHHLTPSPISPSPSAPSHTRISELISHTELKSLIDNLDEKLHQNVKWDNVVDRRNNLLYYNVKCSKPKDSPLKYLSVTVFENCSAEMLRDFYMDNDYRKQWDKTLAEHELLQVDESNGTEIGRTIKKFPFLTPREYILAWRVWAGKDRTFYCFSKECEHPLAARQKKYVRVGFFRSGWRIRKVPGRSACEIKMVHQEDAGLNTEMAKLAFAKGIWSYVCKMDNALRNYVTINHPQLTTGVNAISLIQKVPPELDNINNMTGTAHQETSSANDVCYQVACECNERALTRRPSNKLIANGLILLGGAICLSRGHCNLGAKVAMAYILTKLTKRGASSRQSNQVSVL